MTLFGIPCADFVRLTATSGWAALLLKATLLLAVVWLVHAALAGVNPRWRMLLWRGTAVGLLLLAVGGALTPGLVIRVETPETRLPEAADQPLAAENPIRFVEDDSSQPPRTLATVETASIARHTPTESRSESVLAIESSGRPVPWRAVLLGTWATVAVLLVIRQAIGHLRLAGLLRGARPAPEEIASLSRRIAVGLGCRRNAQVLCSQHVVLPFLYGLRRPVIVLPERMRRPDYRVQLSGVIAHELCARSIA